MHPKFDPATFGAPIIAAVKGYVARANEPIQARLAALEVRDPMVAVEQRLAALPAPDDSVEKFVATLTAKLLA